MKILSSSFDFGGLLAKLQQPSCEERAAAVTEEMLARYATVLAKRGYRLDEKSLEALRLYLSGYGLLLTGNVGTGKTFFFRALRNSLTHCGDDEDNKRIEIFRMSDIAGRKVEDLRDMFYDFRHREVVLDDMGAEPVFNEFGNRWEVLPWLIDMRMDSPCRTHFTSNLTGDEMKKRYGERVTDRLHEMAAQVVFDGRSNRRTMPNAGVVKAVETMRKREEVQKLPQMPK